MQVTCVGIILLKNMFGCPLKFTLEISGYKPKHSYTIMYECENSSPPHELFWKHLKNSLMDSTMSPKVKTMKGEGVGVHSLGCNTLGVEGCVEALGWD